MCGRYALTIDPGDLTSCFPGICIPGTRAHHVTISPPASRSWLLPNDGTNQADFFVWGLIPSWAKDPSIGNRMINARAETLSEKPAFRVCI